MTTSQNTNRKNGNKKLFPKYMQEKLAIAVLVITLALLALVVRLYGLTTEKKEDYNQKVLSQQEYDSRVIPFKRGDILDRNGTILASSQPVYNLIIDPKLIMSKPEYYLDASINALVDCFGYDKTEITNVIQEKRDKAYVRYAKQLTYEQKQAFEQYKKTKSEELKLQNPNIRISGIWFEDEYKREYPFGSLAASVIGFAKADGTEGTGGMEQSYNDVLTGNNGREYGYLNDDSNLERVVKPATDGNTVVSTIDVNVQRTVEKYIDEWESQTGSKNIGVIVMNPSNGEILAMASDRKFDLNDPRNLNGKYTDEELMALGKKEAVADYKRKNKDQPAITEDLVSQYYSADEIMSFGQQVAWNQMWRNFCVSDTFEPGSSAKALTVSAALEEGSITGDETFECHGFLEVGGHKIRCVNRTGGHGGLTVPESLMKSCNVVMMQIAQRTGKDNFYKYQSMFGIGMKTGIDLPGEADTSSLVYNAEKAGSADLATNSFGQSYNCTMVQMAAALSSVINGGSYYKPHVVKQVLNSQNDVVDKMEPLLVRETVSASTSKYINTALWRTVNDKGGTGSAARVEGYDIAGKTGTAEKSPRNKKNYVVSFIGYAPADDPQVLVYVVIDEPNVADQAHSTFATQVFQKIMAECLPQLKIFPVSDITETENPSQAQTNPAETNPEETPAGEAAPAQTQAGETGPPVQEDPSEEYVLPLPEGESGGIPENLPTTAAPQ